MPPRTDTTIIDGLEIRSTQLPAIRAFRLLPKLARIFAPVLAMYGLEKLGNLDVKVLAPVIGEALASLDNADVLACEILASTSAVVDGKIVSLAAEVGINAVYSGGAGMLCMLKTIAWVLRLNFADFFASGVGLQSAGAASQKESSSD